MNKIVFSLLLSTNVILRSEGSRAINDEEENLFQSINQQIQDAVNKIFVLIGLSKNLDVKYDNRLLLALHASLKKSSEKKYSTYKRLREMAKLDEEYIENTNNSLFILDKPINEIIKEAYTMYNSGRKSAKQSESESIEIPENPEEAHLFLRDCLLNAENVELADIAKPIKKITEIADKHELLQRAIRRNFKVWKNSWELDGTRRVFDGHVVPVIKFPFVASIHVDGEFVCTGSIISREMIITAASCLQEAYYNPNYLKDKPGGVFVRVGSDYPDHEGDLIGALSIHFNPLYRASTLRNNLAIIRMKKHLHLRKRNKRIRRIEYKADTPPTTGTRIAFLGWGDKDAAVSGAVEDNRLRHASLSVIDLQKCMGTYTMTYVSDRNFCAANSERSTGACQVTLSQIKSNEIIKAFSFKEIERNIFGIVWNRRDIGGPAVLNSQLIGVISFSPPVCGTADASTVFTSISYHMNWIDSIVNKDKRKLLPSTVGGAMVTQLGNFFIPTSRNIPNDDETKSVIKTKNTASQSRTQTKNKIDTNSLKTDPESHLPRAMHLLSYALRQIMENSYEWKEDKLLNSPELWPPGNTLLMNDRAFANLSDSYFKNMERYVDNDPSFPNTESDKKDSAAPKERNVRESDDDNYESDEKGLSIEYNPTKFTDVTDGIIVDKDLKNLKNDYAQPTIKKFVKTHLKPFKSQSPGFEREAADLLMDNFLKGHITPMNSKSEVSRIKAAIGEYLYGKPRQSQNNKASNELVVMLHKQTTIKDARNRFGVTNNNIYGDLNEKSDIKDFVKMSKDDYIKKMKEQKNKNTKERTIKRLANKKIEIIVASTEQRNKRPAIQNSKTEETYIRQDTEQPNLKSQNENSNILQLVDEESVPYVVTNEDFTNPGATLTTAATTSVEEYVFFRGDSIKSDRRSFLDYFDLS